MDSPIYKNLTMPVGALIAAALFLIVTVVLVVAGVGRAQNDPADSTRGRLITVHDRGAQQVIVSEAATIGDALQDAGIIIEAKDIVEPSVEEELIAPDYQVNIYRARPVIIVDGASRQKIITPYQTAQNIAKDANINLYDEDIATLERTDDILAEGAGLKLTVERAIPIELTLFGKKISTRTQANNVSELLKEKGIKLSSDDRVTPALSAEIKEGLEVKVWREGKQTITVDEAVDFEVEQIQDADRQVGYREIVIPGVKGERSATYEVLIKDGEEASRTEIASIITKTSQRQVEIIGTKPNYSESLAQWLLALRTCESHGNYSTNTGNGFYGAYQFMISTWDRTAAAIGRNDLVNVRPDLASPADQDAMVIANTRRSSAGLASQHPGCYRSLGLSQFPPGY